MSEPQGFLELDRRFREVTEEVKPEDAALDSYAQSFFGQESKLGWNDLLGRRLVIILGEPGSGKTWEFRHRAERLSTGGQCAFFIELEQLVRQPISEALGPANYQRFQNWLGDTEEATFFLDSVDEAKLRRPTDFHVALRKFRDSLGEREAVRARILISSRISEWHPHIDKAELLRLFPGPLPKKVFKDGIAVEVAPEEKEKLIIVKIEPLGRVGVERYAQARNVPAQDFLAALDVHHAWEFVRRPADVADLTSYWLEHKKLGTLTELIESDVSRKLKPSGRDKSDPLSPQQSRIGAAACGAATIFCRQFNFKVPDETFVVTDALDAPACLPEEWRKEQWQALLIRPIFDGASYGRIRFHHRRVAEYLAAKWLEARMAEGCPTTVLDDLLFNCFEGQRVLRPAIAPVAAWLCSGGESWKEDLRGRVLGAAPDIHLVYGDPSCLPLEYKRKLLRALVSRYGKKKHAWIESSPDTLSRLADPALAEDISAIIRDQSLSADLRAKMLLLVRHGRLLACLETALEVIASGDELERLKTYAAAAIRDVGDLHTRRRLASIMASMSQVPNGLCSIACEALYPVVVNAGELVEMLRKTKPVPEFSVDLPYYLESHVKAVVSPEASGELLEHLTKLGDVPPHVSEEIPVSSQFSWLGKVIPTVLEKLFGKPSLTDREVETAASALLWLELWREADRHNHFDDKKLDELNEATSRHPSVRQRYFWSLIEERQLRQPNEPVRLVHLYGYYQTLKLRGEDLPWLLEDIRRRNDPKDQELALRLAIELWANSGRHWRDRKRIRKTIVKDQSLIRIFRQLAENELWVWLKRLWYRHVHYTVGQSWWWGRWFRKMRIHWSWLRDQWILMWNVRTLASGCRPDWLVRLCRETDEHGHSQLGVADWEVLRKKRNCIIAWAAKQGCKCAWRLYMPSLPHEAISNHIDNRLIVGLVGLQASVSDGELDFLTIRDEDTLQAVHYAVNEINGFAPWFLELARHRPGQVREVLIKCIQGEWLIPAEREHSYDVLHDLVWHGESLLPIVQETILALLRQRDPPNQLILRYALAVLMRQPEPPAELLATIAAERIRNLLPESPAFTLWLAIWLQLDAGRALDVMEQRLASTSDADQVTLRLCALLGGERIERGPIIPNPSYLNPRHLRRLIPLVYRHVRSSDDIERAGGGVYSSGDRDDAQRFRSNLLVRLSKNESPETVGVLREFRDDPALVHLRDWIEHLIEEWIVAHADMPEWNPSDIRSFEKNYEVDPITDRDLFRITQNRLRDIKNDVEKSDNSLREEVPIDGKEAVLRRWLARKLKERSYGRYIVPQEEEIDQQDKPDLRIENPKTAPVSIEIKWADNWTLAVLLERLENQLIGQYLRAHNSRYGVYLLGMIGRRGHWESLDGTGELSWS